MISLYFQLSPDKENNIIRSLPAWPSKDDKKHLLDKRILALAF